MKEIAKKKKKFYRTNMGFWISRKNAKRKIDGNKNERNTGWACMQAVRFCFSFFLLNIFCSGFDLVCVKMVVLHVCIFATRTTFQVQMWNGNKCVCSIHILDSSSAHTNQRFRWKRMTEIARKKNTQSPSIVRDSQWTQKKKENNK